MSKRDDLNEWNSAIAGLDGLASKIRADIIGMRESWMRRRLVGLLRWTERWAAKGRQWRNEDIQE